MAYAVLNVASLKKYKPSQVEKLGNGYFLKDGVKPIEGTVKEVSKPPTEASMDQILTGLGLSKDLIKMLPPDQKGMFAAIGEAVTAQYNQGKTVPPEFTDKDIQKIMDEAQNMPHIDDFYKEQLRVGTADFTKAVTSLTGDYNATKAENERQFGFQTKEKADAEAAAGRANSGFRAQAEERLKGDQNYIIESSKRQLQQNLDTMGSTFEKTYGSSALTTAGVPTVDDKTYTPLGGVTGTQESNKETDIKNLKQGIKSDFATAGEVYAGTGDTVTGKPAKVSTTPPSSTVKTPAKAKVTAPKTGRSLYESQGWKYIGSIAQRDQLTKQGKKVKLLGGSYYYK